MNRLRAHTGLVVILVVFWALGALYQQATPLLETPDEPSHFSVVKYVADHWRLPPARPTPPDSSPVPVILPGPPVYYAPPLYYILAAPLIADLDTDGFAEAVIPNPNWARGWAPTPGRSPQNKHIYVHTADQRPPYAGWAAAMKRLRVFSLLLGGVTIAGVYTLAHQTNKLTNQPSSPLPATALVAFNPAFIFVTIGVTNDALLFALSTWAFVLMIQLVKPHSPPLTARLSLLLGVVLGLAALTKQSALAFSPLAVLVIVWSARSDLGPWHTALKRLLLCAVPIVLLAGWWYAHNTLGYGDPLGFQPHQTPAGEWQPPLSLLVRQLGQALKGYWGAFGWGLILVDPIIYVFAALLVLGGGLGWLRQLTADRRSFELSLRTKPLTASPRIPNTEYPILTILTLGVLLNLTGLILWLWRTSAPYGRLLFPTLGPLAVLLVMGWRRWLGHERGRLFAWGAGLAMALYAAVVPWRYLQPAYASPVVSLSILDKVTPLDVQFGDRLHLLGYQMSPESAQPGDQVTLTLYWQMDVTTDTPLRDATDATVFVQLAPQDPRQRIASLDDFVGTSRHPTSVWQVGEVIEQVHRVRLPGDAPSPSLYWFNVGLYDAPGGERWPGTADGAPLPERTVRLGPLRVLNDATLSPQQRVEYRFGAAIRLTGYDVELSQPDNLNVTLYWQADDAPGEDLTVFVHLLDAKGQSVTQHDGPPRRGDYPTWAWGAGDRVPDTHLLALPAALAPGTYHLLVGLYRPDDGTRLPVFDSQDQRVPDDALYLTDVDWQK
jgi:hypothetical protein